MSSQAIETNFALAQTSSVLLVYTYWVKTTHYEIMEKGGPVPFTFPIHIYSLFVPFEHHLE